MKTRIWVPCIALLRTLDNPSMEPSDYVSVYKLGFHLEFDGNYLPVTEWEHHKYRYKCSDCFLAAGAAEDEVFATDFAEAKDIEDGPTEEQSKQINKHAKQHQIMWSWVKGLK
jgi:hypothetical protein